MPCSRIKWRLSHTNTGKPPSPTQEYEFVIMLFSQAVPHLLPFELFFTLEAARQTIAALFLVLSFVCIGHTQGTVAAGTTVRAANTTHQVRSAPLEMKLPQHQAERIKEVTSTSPAVACIRFADGAAALLGPSTPRTPRGRPWVYARGPHVWPDFCPETNPIKSSAFPTEVQPQ